jgi:hypothetical protein
MSAMHNLLVRNICQKLGIYTYVDVEKALKAEQQCLVRGRYRSYMPTDHQLTWILSHSSWSRVICEGSRKDRTVYEYVEQGECNGKA